MKDRRMTLMIIPHDKPDTRSFEISYRVLKLVSILLVGLILTLGTIAAYGWSMAARALRVPGLERELARLEEERESVAELAQALAEVEQQYERVRNILSIDGAARAGGGRTIPPSRSMAQGAERGEFREDIPGSWPLVQTGFITRERSDDAEREGHPGIDIAVPQGSYIRASAAGVVSSAGTDDIYGSYILIRHADGYETMYGHASQLFVAAGDSVSRHEVVALSGSTGRSTAPHLHFEIRKDGLAIDPLPLIRKP